MTGTMIPLYSVVTSKMMMILIMILSSSSSYLSLPVCHGLLTSMRPSITTTSTIMMLTESSWTTRREGIARSRLTTCPSITSIDSSKIRLCAKKNDGDDSGYNNDDQPFRRSSKSSSSSAAAAAASSIPVDINNNYYTSNLINTLHEYGYNRRLIHLSFPLTTVSSDDSSFNTDNNHHRWYWAEFQDQGKTKLCQIVNVVLPINKNDDNDDDDRDVSTSLSGPPKLQIVVMDDDDNIDNDDDDGDVDTNQNKRKFKHTRIVDVGQITTIWDHDDDENTNNNHYHHRNYNNNDKKRNNVNSMVNTWNHHNVEDTLEGLYRSRVGCGRQDGSTTTSHITTTTTNVKPLNKKSISKVAKSIVENKTNNNKKQQICQERKEQQQQHIEVILRQLIKAGTHYVRLVDSAILRDAVGVGTSSSQKQQQQQQQELLHSQRQLAASILGDETFTVGRFKRMPCMWTSTTTKTNNNDATTTTTVSFINGGWLVVDQSVRASTEGRTYASTVVPTTTTTMPSSSSNRDRDTANTKQQQQQQQSTPTLSQITSFDRITHRLECLAMGEDGSSSSSSSSSSTSEGRLEVDVRAALLSMDLPLSPDGARRALLRTGHWSEVGGGASTGQSYTPWSSTVLKAAEWYTRMAQKRRRTLYDETVQQSVGGSTIKDQSVPKKKNTKLQLEGRVDLTHLPCVCVDTAKAKFRDDAIGIRPRASTGRKVHPTASKWEILLHIADVSDIYCPEPYPALFALPTGTKSIDDNMDDYRDRLQVLARAAASRGTSRYDLPLGPLHMLPPTVLDSFALETVKPNNSRSTTTTTRTQERVGNTVNRCVTVWVYIDERSGKVIDAGVERTLISRPLALSFQDATELLDRSEQPPQEQQQGHGLTRAQAILTVADRNIQLWKEYHRMRSNTAREREERLAAYEEIGQQMHGAVNRATANTTPRNNDDGSTGFQRSLGHRLVDSAMDLYGYAISGLMHRSSTPYLPRVSGTRSGRVATAPLRRYVDGMAQRQVLSVLCDYGGRPLTNQECIEVGQKATETLNTIENVNVSKRPSTSKGTVFSRPGRSVGKGTHNGPQQQSAARMLKLHMRGGVDCQSVPALTTGSGNEVVIVGVGAIATCKGMKGTLRPGKKVMVKIEHIDDQNGKIIAILDKTYP